MGAIPRLRARGQGGCELPHDPRELIRLCKVQGWSVEYTRAGRTRLTSPDGKTVVMGKQRGDWRATSNTRSHLKRAGLRPALPLPTERPPAQPLPQRLLPAPLSLPSTKLAPLENSELPTKAPPSESTPSIPPDFISTDSLELAMNANLQERAELKVTDVFPLKRGDRRRVILDAVRRAELGAGVHPSTIVDRVRARIPDIGKDRIQIAMAGYAKSGWLERRNEGRYSLTADGENFLAGNTEAPTKEPASPSPRPRQRRGGVEALAQLPDQHALSEDVRALDEALVALAGLERVIRRHRDIAIRCAQLKTALGLTVGEEPAVPTSPQEAAASS